MGTAVLYDEYKHDSQSALHVLDEAAQLLNADDPKVVNQRAKVLYTMKEYGPALNVFRAALSNSELPVVERIFSSRLAAICAARINDWGSAEELFLGGASTARAHNLDHIMAVGLIADGGFAIWKQGKQREALSVYAEVLRELEQIPLDENLHNRRLHGTVRHCLAWIATSGRIGGDDPLAEPPPGVCSNPDSHEGFKDLKIVSMPAIWGLLGTIDVRLGTNLGLTKLADEKYGNEIPLLMRLHGKFAAYEALWKKNEFSAAVPEIFRFIEANIYQKQNQGTLDSLLMQAGEIPPLTKEYWSKAENRASVLYNLLALAILTYAKSFESQLPLDCWKEDLKVLEIFGPEVDDFFHALNGNLTVGSSEFLNETASCLHKLRSRALSPTELFACHFRLLNFLTSCDCGLFVTEDYSQMVCRQWLGVAENQKFALNAPSVYVPLLKEKCQAGGLSGYASAAAMLEVAASASSVKVAESGKQFLARVKAGEFPIRNS
ncbi:MAG: hypothetical protein Q8P17_04845 [bacterium]|nr:hypothetical protein [bacterium]